MFLPRLLVGLLLSAGALCAPAAVAAVPNPDPALVDVWQPCEPDTGVTVVVDRNDRLGNGRIDVRCALGPQANGWQALIAAGFDVEGVGGGIGFVCRIDELPAPLEEPCLLTPGGDRYWSYWHGKPGGRWAYSGVGAASPLSAAPVNAVQGWGFGRSPRIEPMHGAGPSAFVLPGAQESSTVPAALARDWLTETVAETGRRAQTGELAPQADVTWGAGLLELLALDQAGVDPERIAPFAEWLADEDGLNALQWANVAGTANPPIEPADPEHWTYWNLGRLPLVVLGLKAAGHDPADFAGHDLRAQLLQAIDPSTGRLRARNTPGSLLYMFFGEWTVDDSSQPLLAQSAFAYAGVLRALLATGGLPEDATATVQHFLAKQDPATGSFGVGVDEELWSLWALAELKRAGVAGVDEPLERAADFLASLQADDGGVRQRADGSPVYDPNVQSTAFGAAGLALAGRQEAAEQAAKWVSRYQVTAAYAGTPTPGGDDVPPAFDAIGAFLPNEDALRNALAFGVASNEFGLFNEARPPTAAALLGLSLAGPYGPYYVTLDEQSLWFDGQTVGTGSGARTVTLTNRDERPVTVTGVHPAGEQAGDFTIDAADCAGRTLAPGAHCELSAAFEPTVAGVRQAIVHLPLAGAAQTVVVSLGGTALPAPDRVVDPVPDPPSGGGPDPSPGPQPPAEPRSSRRASVAGLAGPRPLNGRRVATLARLTCPAGGSCQVTAPRRVWIAIAGKRYRAAVIAPRSIAPGRRAAVRVRIPKAAAKALKGRRARVELRVAVTSQGTRTARTVATTIGGAS